MSDDIDRRLSRLEREQEKMEDILSKLVVSTTRMGDLLEDQKRLTPKIDALNDELVTMKLEQSNTKLVQRGFLWLSGIVGSSAVTIAMAFVFGSR